MSVVHLERDISTQGKYFNPIGIDILGVLTSQETTATQQATSKMSRDWGTVYNNLMISNDSMRRGKIGEFIDHALSLLDTKEREILIDILMYVHGTANTAEYQGNIIPGSQESGYPIHNCTYEGLRLKIQKGNDCYKESEQLLPSISNLQFSHILKDAMREGLCGVGYEYIDDTYRLIPIEDAGSLTRIDTGLDSYVYISDRNLLADGWGVGSIVKDYRIATVRTDQIKVRELSSEDVELYYDGLFNLNEFMQKYNSISGAMKFGAYNRGYKLIPQKEDHGPVVALDCVEGGDIRSTKFNKQERKKIRLNLLKLIGEFLGMDSNVIESVVSGSSKVPIIKVIRDNIKVLSDGTLYITDVDDMRLFIKMYKLKIKEKSIVI